MRSVVSIGRQCRVISDHSSEAVACREVAASDPTFLSEAALGMKLGHMWDLLHSVFTSPREPHAARDITACGQKFGYSDPEE